MSSRTRITLALVGLILLVVFGWVVRGQSGGEQRSLTHPPADPSVTSGRGELPHSNDAVVDLYV